MASGNREVWPMYHVWPISERFMLGWSGDMLSLAEHWHGRRALSNHVSAPSVISMWHVLYLYHLARACSKQSKSTPILPINHLIQMPQCLSGFVNHDYWVTYLSLKFNRDLWANRYIRQSTHDTIMSYINTCMVVIDMFYIGMTEVLVDGIHYLEPQKNVFCVAIRARATPRHYIILLRTVWQLRHADYREFWC